jgi:hypothetical protein
MWSNQESIRTGPGPGPRGIQTSPIRGYPITKAGYRAKKSPSLSLLRDGPFVGLLKQSDERKDYSIARRNSNPKRRISPAASWRNTLAVIGGVSLGTRLEAAGDGAGMVKCTI